MERVFQKYGRIVAVLILLWVVFFDLIPETLESGLSPLLITVLIFLGFAVCALLGHFLRRFHRHESDHETLENRKQATIMLIVDTIHNAADGLVLGIAFAANLDTGLAVLLSTVAHEIPQEIGDFSIMLRSGLSIRKVILLEALSACALLPTAFLALFIGDRLSPLLPHLLSLITGFLFYMVFSEISGIINKTKENHQHDH